MSESIDEFTDARIKRQVKIPPWHRRVDEDREHECVIYLLAVTLFNVLVVYEATSYSGFRVGALLGATMIVLLIGIEPYLDRYVRHQRAEDIFRKWRDR